MSASDVAGILRNEVDDHLQIIHICGSTRFRKKLMEAPTNAELVRWNSTSNHHPRTSWQ